jgi:hypothetical protein
MSVSETIAAIGVAGLAVGIALFAFSAPQDASTVWLNATFPAQVESKAWSPLELVALGTLLVSFLATVSGIYFKWREDRRAARELDARLSKLEAQAKDEQR